MKGKRYHYPLIGVYADKFVHDRLALLGDAAVGMHPVTAHGFNLGLKGQKSLCELVVSAQRAGKDIGSIQILNRYHHKHNRDCRLMYLGTNAIVRLFTHEHHASKIIRKMVLRVGNVFSPAKRLIMKQLTHI